MKRFHVHAGVSDLEQSIAFYTGLFGQAPSVMKSDYAKWMLDDPRINFAISLKGDGARGVEHLGLQAESEAELAEVRGRLEAAGRPVLEEGATTCCYAQSEKSWIADPDGVVWEAFLTNGELTVYGAGPALDRRDTADSACCTPATLQGVCCPPKIERPAAEPCCGVV